MYLQYTYYIQRLKDEIENEMEIKEVYIKR